MPVAPSKTADVTGPTTGEVSQLLALFQAGRQTELESIALLFVQLHPESGIVWKVLGAALQAQGKEALSALKKASELLPDDAETFNNLGDALRELGHLDQAIASHRRAIALRPSYFEAHNNLGVVLQCQAQYDDAIASYRNALTIKPDSSDAYGNLGASLQSIGQLDQAVASFRRAIKINPNNASAHNNLSNALQSLGYLEEAAASCRQALVIRPTDVGANINLGIIFQGLERFDDALASFDRALALDPHNGKAKFNRSFTLFSTGRLAEAWVDYEHRPAKATMRQLAYPHWAGEGLVGKSILILGEQGVGDEIMFASMFAEIVDRPSHCVIECAHKLLPLFARSFPDAQIVPRTQPPHPATQELIDYQCAAGSLGRYLRPTTSHFSKHCRYLTPSPERVTKWQGYLAALGSGLKVGFCWRSSLTGGRRDPHYSALDQWGPIFTLPGVHFVNLQYDKCDAELDAARQQFGVPLHAFSEVDLLDDLDEAAALTQALDLVISAGTAACVMAAALGVPTWLLSTGVDWTTLGTDHTPWFPTQRSFSRRWNQPWSEVIEAVAQQLELTTLPIPMGDGEKHAE